MSHAQKQFFWALCLFLSLGVLLWGCGRGSDRIGFGNRPATVTGTEGPTIYVSGSFSVAVIEDKIGNNRGAVTSLYVDGLNIPLGESFAYYDIGYESLFNVAMSADNTTGVNIFALAMNDIYYSINYMTSASTDLPPEFPAFAYYVAPDGRYYEANPQFLGTGGTLTVDMGVDLPQRGDQLSGRFGFTMAYLGTYPTTSTDQ